MRPEFDILPFHRVNFPQQDVVMGWLGQVVVQSIIVGLTAVGLFRLPSPSLKMFCGAFLIWFLITIGRNPLLFYQRITRLIVGSSLPFLVAGISFRASGSTQLPGEFGHVAWAIEQGSSANLWLIASFFAGALVMDGILAAREFRSRTREMGTDIEDAADLSFEPEAEIQYRPVIEASQTEATISGADIHMKGAWPKRFRCTVYAPPDLGIQYPIRRDKPLKLASGQREVLRIEARIEGVHYRRWLRVRTTWLPFSLVPLHAVCQLTAAPRSMRHPLPLTINLIR